MTTTLDRTSAPTPYRMFHASVLSIRPLCPTFVRVTLGSEELHGFADNGYDQRIKLILPVASGFEHLPSGPDWYQRWRELPVERQNPFRTYTVRAARPAAGEVDLDMVRHGDAGPASSWLGRARPGDPVALLGPDAAYPGVHGGLEWAPPTGTRRVLLAGDETAVPAVAAIVERLPDTARGHVLLEVPHREDRLELGAPAGVRVTWLAREDRAHGTLLDPAVREVTRSLLPGVHLGTEPEDVDIDHEVLWDVPGREATAARGGEVTDGFYAWFAGEAAVIKGLRRHLVRDLGVGRGSVAFMGYWRAGRAEG